MQNLERTEGTLSPVWPQIWRTGTCKSMPEKPLLIQADMRLSQVITRWAARPDNIAHSYSLAVHAELDSAIDAPSSISFSASLQHGGCDLPCCPNYYISRSR